MMLEESMGSIELFLFLLVSIAFFSEIKLLRNRRANPEEKES